MNSPSRRESHAIPKTIIAIILMVGCLGAAQWQYHRGVARHMRNSVIEKNSSMQPVPLAQLLHSIGDNEWRPAQVTGSFDLKRRILLRNFYSEGVYGFEYLTRFSDASGHSFWVDCGWVKAGTSASVQPDLPVLPVGQVSIVGRLRLDSSLPQGSFFAIPTNKTDGLIAKANAQSGSVSENFYLDLISGDTPTLTPQVAASLPELSDGPHMAYALQWLFFAGLILYGRYLIRRDVLSHEEL